ncbi:hypothetical protein ACFE04_023093 [Oxalis oulophora]
MRCYILKTEAVDFSNRLFWNRSKRVKTHMFRESWEIEGNKGGDQLGPSEDTCQSSTSPVIISIVIGEDDDSDEEFLEPEEEEHEFSEAEDHIIWAIVQEHGEDDEVLNTVSQNLLERYATLGEKYRDKEPQTFRCGIPLDNSLSAALDSFDNLFCPRCLVFDCPLHGSSQTIILPVRNNPVYAFICSIALTFTQKPHSSSSTKGRGKYMLVANIARILSVSITDMVVKKRVEEEYHQIQAVVVHQMEDGPSSRRQFLGGADNISNSARAGSSSSSSSVMRHAKGTSKSFDGGSRSLNRRKVLLNGPSFSFNQSIGESKDSETWKENPDENIKNIFF